MSNIKEITALATFDVRHPVLRPGKPIETCRFDGDDLDSTHHFGLFTSEKLIGVVSVYEKVSPLFSEKNPIQLRGMAVLEDYQKKGLGEKLVKYCEDYVVSRKSSLLWFNARKNAVGFYEKLGYQVIGDAFDIPTVGIHYVMFKYV